MAANPISFTEIDAYCRLNGLVMSSWELGLLRRLDAIALAPAGMKPAAPSKPADGPEQSPASPADVAKAKQIVRGAAGHRRIVKRKPK